MAAIAVGAYALCCTLLQSGRKANYRCDLAQGPLDTRLRHAGYSPWVL